jgi:hypothetical protein
VPKLMLEAARLHFSTPAPLNRRPKRLQMLAWDLEADPGKGTGRTTSIAQKSSSARSLALVFFIILIPAQ